MKKHEFNILVVVMIILMIMLTRNAYQIRENRSRDQSIIEELEIINDNQREILSGYQELHGAYEYLDERIELHRAGHE